MDLFLQNYFQLLLVKVRLQIVHNGRWIFGILIVHYVHVHCQFHFTELLLLVTQPANCSTRGGSQANYLFIQFCCNVATDQERRQQLCLLHLYIWMEGCSGSILSASSQVITLRPIQSNAC